MMAISKNEAMPTLDFLLTGISDVTGVADLPISAIRMDSRKVKPGDLFIAIDGVNVSGTNYIQDAVHRGAVAILLDAEANVDISVLRTPVFRISDLRFRTGLIASRFYGDPSRKMSVTGITGTNGKTSVAYFLAQTLANNGQYPVGSIGTLGYGLTGKLLPGVNTTPDAVTVQELLAGFLAQGAADTVMEVSSHALEQDRVSGVSFDTAVFTNLSRDHLDYHPNMSAYANAKKKLFVSAGLKNAVVNIDDSLGRELANQFSTRLNVVTYGINSIDIAAGSSRPALFAVIRHQTINSMLLDINSPWGAAELQVQLSGVFNALNILATLAVLCLRGIGFDIAMQRLSRVSGVPGRLEYFGNDNSARIFVDYSHTPDALEKALVSLRGLGNGKLFCVFGCGGNRDKGKRPEMGRTAERYADHIILTSDNPRNESPEQIVQDIVTGIQGHIPVEIELDRARAIRAAIDYASTDDIVLIAGKGHETYQEVGTIKIPFSDRQLVRNLLEGKL